MSEELVQQLILSAAQIVIPILVTTILGVLTNLLLNVRQFVVAKVGSVNYERVVDIVREGVRFAEQNGLADEVRRTGAEKKQQALTYIIGALDNIGLGGYLPVKQLVDLIESVVLEELNPPFVVIDESDEA